jgi:hypothetical protein
MNMDRNNVSPSHEGRCLRGDVGRYRTHHEAAREELAVVVAAIDPPEETVDTSPDVDGVVHDLSR